MFVIEVALDPIVTYEFSFSTNEIGSPTRKVKLWIGQYVPNGSGSGGVSATGVGLAERAEP